jgi:group I intron endonuclease
MKKIGIYKITSPSGKVYIGQSIDIEKRRNCYKNLNIPKQPKIYNSIKKYSWENHTHNIIEECSVEQLNERETYWKQYYLNQFDDDWEMILFCNLHDTGGGPLSKETKEKIGKIHKGAKRSDETKKKISESKKGFKFSKESKELKSRIAKGIPKSQETKRKMSESHKGKKTSEETKIKMKQSYQNMSSKNKLKIINSVKNIPKNKRIEMSRNKWKSVSQFSLSGEWINDFISIQEASKQTNIRHDSISQCCNQKNKTAGNYVWRFK